MDEMTDQEREDFAAAKLASRIEFIRQQLARTPDERLDVMVEISRRLAALRADVRRV